MTNHFANALQACMERQKLRNVTLEKKAGLPNATVAKLLAGQRPEPARAGQILKAIGGDEAADLLRAYLLDAVPADWRENVSIMVEPISANRIRETTTGTDRLSSALMALRSAAAGDRSLAQWIINTAEMLQLEPG